MEKTIERQKSEPIDAPRKKDSNKKLIRRHTIGSYFKRQDSLHASTSESSDDEEEAILVGGPKTRRNTITSCKDLSATDNTELFTGSKDYAGKPTPKPKSSSQLFYEPAIPQSQFRQFSLCTSHESIRQSLIRRMEATAEDIKNELSRLNQYRASVDSNLKIQELEKKLIDVLDRLVKALRHELRSEQKNTTSLSKQKDKLKSHEIMSEDLKGYESELKELRSKPCTPWKTYSSHLARTHSPTPPPSNEDQDEDVFSLDM